MRVVLVSLSRRGGMVHFLAELANAMESICRTAVVISRSAEGSYFSRRIRRVRVDTGRAPTQVVLRTLRPATWASLNEQLASLGADLVHIVGIHQWNPGVALLSRAQKIPVVYTVHDPDAHPGAPFSIRVADWTTRQLVDQLVVLTPHGRDRLLKRPVAGRRSTMIPHPAYTLFRRWRSKGRFAYPYLLYLGRIEPYKGLDALIEAFVAARDSLPGWKLVIAGEGLLPSSLAKVGTRDIVVKNRYLSDREVAQLVQNASILVAPYREASQSGVVAIAAAFGTPVIATRTGGLGHMVVHKKTGLLVPPCDTPALAQAVGTLAADAGERRRMRAEMLRRTRTIWNPARIAEQHVELYSRVLRRRVRT